MTPAQVKAIMAGQCGTDVRGQPVLHGCWSAGCPRRAGTSANVTGTGPNSGDESAARGAGGFVSERQLRQANKRAKR